MIKEKPEVMIGKIIEERYKNARTVFWSAPNMNNQVTTVFNLEIVIIYDYLPSSYRESFIYDGWPIDVFVHDAHTLGHFFEKVDRNQHKRSLAKKVYDGIELPVSTLFGEHLKSMAQEIMEKGPIVSNKSLYFKRFTITNLLVDVKNSASPHELITSSCRLYEELAGFYLLSHGQWLATGKAMTKALEECDPKIAEKFYLAFNDVFKLNSYEKLELLTINILSPYGGLLWDGFRGDTADDIDSTEALENSKLDPLRK